MKSFILVLAAFLIIHNFTNSQGFFYTELNSGVTSNLTSVCIVPSFSPNQVWVCGDGGVVLKSTNSGTNWTGVGSNGISPAVNLVTISCRANDTALTAGNTGTTTFVYRTVNGGLNWSQVFTQANGVINSIWMRNSLQGFMVGNPVGGRWSLWKTTNGGANWDSTGLYIPQAGGETGFNNSLAIMYNYIWFGTNNSRIYKSSNNGVNWSFVSTPRPNTTAVWIYHDTNSYTHAQIGSDSIYSTQNSGTNWLRASCPDTGNIKGFSPAYIGVSDWQPMANYCTRINKIYYAYGGGGFYNLEYTAPAGNYNHLGYDVGMSYSQSSYAVRTNGGITRVQLFRGGAVTLISNEIPREFGLLQNYPNPFNPNTNIRLNIASPGFVKLIIYDILGREVSIIVNEMLRPGIYEASWNAANNPSGIYFYRLVTDKFTETRKMMLIK